MGSSKPGENDEPPYALKREGRGSQALIRLDAPHAGVKPASSPPQLPAKAQVVEDADEQGIAVVEAGRHPAQCRQFRW